MLVLQLCEAHHERRCYFDAMPALYCLKTLLIAGCEAHLSGSLTCILSELMAKPVMSVLSQANLLNQICCMQVCVQECV